LEEGGKETRTAKLETRNGLDENGLREGLILLGLGRVVRQKVGYFREDLRYFYFEDAPFQEDLRFLAFAERGARRGEWQDRGRVGIEDRKWKTEKECAG
jgi:hypothetical protein